MFITFSPFLGNGCKVKWRIISLTLTVTIISNWSLNVKFFSGAIYYIFILSWGFLISGFDPTIVLQCCCVGCGSCFTGSIKRGTTPTPFFLNPSHLTLGSGDRLPKGAKKELGSRLVTQTLDRTQVFSTGGFQGLSNFGFPHPHSLNKYSISNKTPNVNFFL